MSNDQPPRAKPAPGRISLPPRKEFDENGAHSSPSSSPSSAPSTPGNEGPKTGPRRGKEDHEFNAAQSPWPPGRDVLPVTSPPPRPSVFVYPTRSLLAGVRRDTDRRDSIATTPTPMAGRGDSSGDYFQARPVRSPSNICGSGTSATIGGPSAKDDASPIDDTSIMHDALPSLTSVVMLPPVNSSRDAAGDDDSSISPEYEPREVDEPCQAAREAQRASEAHERQLEDKARMRQFVTTPFEYKRGETGNHLIVGYAGNFTRCEDEPIHTPGAVQAFGVLVALRRSGESSFEVRQVSENSAEILALSPPYLFDLECFTDTLPEDQAERLFQALTSLSDLPFDHVEPEDQTPQLMEVAGFGEPDTARPGDVSDELNRRRWLCTCALHRVPQPAAADGLPPRQPLLVLEFELHNDTVNPMRPQESQPLPSKTLSVPSRSSSSAGDYGTASSSGSGLTTSDGTGSDAGCQPDANSASSDEEPTSPSKDDIRESTTMFSRPIREIERARAAAGPQNIRFNYGADTPSSSFPAGAPTPLTRSARGQSRRAFRQSLKSKAPHDVSVDVVSVMTECNEQLAAALDLETFLKVVVGLVKYMTEFHRVLVYQFDDEWNGQTVAELVDRTKSKDIFRGLHFPASDIPEQARKLYAINKVRSLYDRDQPSARIVCKSKEDLETPLDMTHSLLRAMSPVHIKYLRNMQVRASMSISITAFKKLWGLIACHSYGEQGMRVSFHTRQVLRLFAAVVSQNLERLSFAHHLQTRNLLATAPRTQDPSGYILSNADDFLKMFTADDGILVVGNVAKIMGKSVHGQELLIIAEYLRIKCYSHIVATSCLSKDHPELRLPFSPDEVAGMLYVPLTPDGNNFIAFLRKTQVQYLHWAGQPVKKEDEQGALNPRESFATWTQVVHGTCEPWALEQLDIAATLALVYGKFIEVWQAQQSAARISKSTQLLLSHAEREVRTPLTQMIGFLEHVLAAPLDRDTRKNLARTHEASKGLLFTINDLLDLNRLETGLETTVKEPFDLPATIVAATKVYQKEAERRTLSFVLDTATSPTMVWGDRKKLCSAIANLTANAVKYTSEGSITVACHVFEEPGTRRAPGQVVVSVSVSDTGCGIPSDRLDNLFRQIEEYQPAGYNASSSASASTSEAGVSEGGAGGTGQSQTKDMDRNVFPLGLGLAVVARIVQQAGGQLRVQSKVNKGSTFQLLLPFRLYDPEQTSEQARILSPEGQVGRTRPAGERDDSSAWYESSGSNSAHSVNHDVPNEPEAPGDGDARNEVYMISSIKIEGFAADRRPPGSIGRAAGTAGVAKEHSRRVADTQAVGGKLRVMVVDDDRPHRKLLAEWLERDGHLVKQCGAVMEAVDILANGEFAPDCIFMDTRMPSVDGFEATKRIREMELAELFQSPSPDERSALSRPPRKRIAVVAMSASLTEHERDLLFKFDLDGWLPKPVDFQRVGDLIRGIHDLDYSRLDVYAAERSWDSGGWLRHGLGSRAEHDLCAAGLDVVAE